MKEALGSLAARVRRLDPDRALRVVVALLLALLAIQGLRYAFAGHAMRSIASRAKASAEVPARTGQKPFSDYDVILEKNLIGMKGRPSAPQENVYGILGSKVLLGASPQDAKPYAVGAALPSGGVLVEITASGAVVEKDGEKRTLTTFPIIPPPAAPPQDKPPGTPEGEATPA